MATNTIYQYTPFGFNMVKLGTLLVYCGKLRFRGIRYEPKRAYLNVEYRGPYCIISFEVIDRELANSLYRELAILARDIAQAKLNNKWGWITH